MLVEAKFAELYPEWLDFIELEETKAAFVYIVGLAACARSLSCHPQLKGENGPVRDFRFFDMEGKQYFSFITNRKKPLLFYFRAPATRSGRYSFAALKAEFHDANEPRSEEWTVPLRSVSDVQRLWSMLEIA